MHNLNAAIAALDEISGLLRQLSNTRRRRWTAREIEVLHELYPHCPASLVGWALNRSESSVYAAAAKHGLKKPADWYLNPLSNCNRPGDAIHGRKSRFRPGNVPHNKGHKGWSAGGRSAETQFRLGQMPHNHRPIGSYRITYGILQRKISEAKGNNSRRWRSVHELVWIEHHGPVPAGHICVFKPGKATTNPDLITIDRVECISLAENMRRNSLHRYGPEIARAMQLRGALTRQLNRRTKAREKQDR